MALRLTGKKLEIFFLLVVFTIFLWTGYAALAENRLHHDFPSGYRAMDAFTHLTFLTILYDQGVFDYLPTYMTLGYENVVAANPPLVYYISAVLANLTGLQPHDALMFTVALISLLAVFVMYVTLRNFNRKIAILSLPLAVFLFKMPFLVGLIWGQFPFLVGASFLVAVFWVMSRFDIKYSFVLLGLFLAGTALGHTAQFVVALGLIIVFLFVKFMTKDKFKAHTKQVIFAGILGFALSIYYLIIFKNTLGRAQFSLSLKPILPAAVGNFPVPIMTDFGLAVILIFLGLIMALLVLSKHKLRTHFVLITALYILAISFTNYLGQFRAVQVRFFWPVFLAPFFGLGLYSIPFIKKRRGIFVSVVVSLVLLLGFATFSVPRYEGTGIVTAFSWKAFGWMDQNLEENATVFYMYGDGYDQKSMLYRAKRPSYEFRIHNFSDKVSTGKKTKYFVTIPVIFADTSYAYRKSPFRFGYYYEEDNLVSQPLRETSICDYDYVVFNTQSLRRPIHALYNQLIMGEMIQNNDVHVVYQNDLLSIVQNKEPGGECIAEGQF